MPWKLAFLFVSLPALAFSEPFQTSNGFIFNIRGHSGAQPHGDDSPTSTYTDSPTKIVNTPPAFYFPYQSHLIHWIRTDYEWKSAFAESQWRPIVIAAIAQESSLTATYELLARQYPQVVFYTGTYELLQPFGLVQSTDRFDKLEIFVFFRGQNYVCTLEGLSSVLDSLLYSSTTASHAHLAFSPTRPSVDPYTSVIYFPSTGEHTSDSWEEHKGTRRRVRRNTNYGLGTEEIQQSRSDTDTGHGGGSRKATAHEGSFDKVTGHGGGSREATAHEGSFDKVTGHGGGSREATGHGGGSRESTGHGGGFREATGHGGGSRKVTGHGGGSREAFWKEYHENNRTPEGTIVKNIAELWNAQIALENTNKETGDLSPQQLAAKRRETEKITKKMAKLFAAKRKKKTKKLAELFAAKQRETEW